MSRSAFTRLDPAIAGIAVDADQAAAAGWFGVVRDESGAFVPFMPDGMADLVQPLRAPTAGGQLGDIDWTAVDRAVARVGAACGPSRARGKARALAFCLHLSLAANGILAPPSAVTALGRALSLESDMARLGARRAGPGHWVESWLEADTGAGPLPEDLLALRIAMAAPRNGRAPLGVRRAVWSIFHLLAAQRRSPSASAINALGVVCGALGEDDKIQPLAAQHILARDARTLRRLVAADARAQVRNGRNAPAADRDVPEDASRLRRSGHYKRAVAGQVRDLQGPAAAFAEFAADEAATEAVWARWTRPRADGRRLADWRRTYWRKFADRRRAAGAPEGGETSPAE